MWGQDSGTSPTWNHTDGQRGGRLIECLCSEQPWSQSLFVQNGETRCSRQGWGPASQGSESFGPWVDKMMNSIESIGCKHVKIIVSTYYIFQLNSCLRTFKPEKDQHPVQFLLSELNPGIYEPLMTWLNENGGAFQNPSRFAIVSCFHQRLFGVGSAVQPIKPSPTS